MPTPPKITGRPPGEADKAWLEHVRSDIQKEPERLEETAKFLSGIISISLTIFITNPPAGLAAWTKGWFFAATVLWVLSTLLSFFVLFPWRYRFVEDDPNDIRRAYRKIVTTKRRLLVFSSGAFLLALGLACFAFLVG